MAAKIKIKYITDFEFCDKNHFLIIKGISILLGLVSYVLRICFNINWLSPLQGIAAAVFLFCSGFGVAESYRHKRGLVHFWENKIIGIWIPSLVAMVLVALIADGFWLKWIAESAIGLKGNLLYFFFGCYAAFWLVFSFFENRATKCIGLFVIAGVAVLFVPNQTLVALLPCFPAGVLFSQYGMKYKVREMKTGGKTLLCTVCLLFAAGGWVLKVLLDIPYVNTLVTAITNLSAALFLLVAVFAAHKVPVFGIFVPFGYMAYGLYLFYDTILVMLKTARDLETAALIVLFLFAVAGVYSWLREMLIASSKKNRRRKNPRLKGRMW